MNWLAAPLVLALLQVPGGGVASQTSGDIAVVRAMYAGAAYEDALAQIAALDPSQVTPDLELYRALCFLALARPVDSVAALERVVQKSPLFALPEAEVTPRILTMFRDVRRRTLPVVAREAYAVGKALYDDRRFTDAVQQFRRVNAMLADPDLAYPADAFADLRQLTEGFMRLAELEIAAVAKAMAPFPAAPAAAPPAAVPAVASSAPAPDFTVTRIVVYTREDVGVTPPVEVERLMPPWVPPAAIARSGHTYSGEVEIVVDETGRVEQARMSRPTTPAYDVTLLGATRRWRFEPARRGSEAVKYLLTFQIVLSPARR